MARLPQATGNRQMSSTMEEQLKTNLDILAQEAESSAVLTEGEKLGMIITANLFKQNAKFLIEELSKDPSLKSDNGGRTMIFGAIWRAVKTVAKVVVSVVKKVIKVVATVKAAAVYIAAKVTSSLLCGKIPYVGVKAFKGPIASNSTFCKITGAL